MRRYPRLFPLLLRGSGILAFHASYRFNGERNTIFKRGVSLRPTVGAHSLIESRTCSEMDILSQLRIKSGRSIYTQDILNGAMHLLHKEFDIFCVTIIDHIIRFRKKPWSLKMGLVDYFFPSPTRKFFANIFQKLFLLCSENTLVQRSACSQRKLNAILGAG